LQIRKKARSVRAYQQILVKALDGMGGVMNERHLEANVMGQQAGVEDVVPLVPSEIVRKNKWK
jgi:hypothetical protein